MSYPPEFLQRVDEFIRLANKLADGGHQGEASAAILFAAGRYNAFNFLSHGGGAEDQAKAIEFYVSEYRKAFTSNLAGDIGPLVQQQG